MGFETLQKILGFALRICHVLVDELIYHKYNGLNRLHPT